MKKVIISMMFALMGIFSSHATVLFPHFVDIAPDYHKGITPELIAAGVKNVVHYSTTSSFYPSTFTEVECFYKDTLPGDVIKEERKIGPYRMLIYTAVNRPDDTIDTGELWSRIYVLEMPDNKFQSAYSEMETERGSNNPF